MENDWVVVYSVDKLYKAELIREKLEENELGCTIVDKSTPTLLIGDIEIYVRKEDEENARKIIDELDF